MSETFRAKLQLFVVHSRHVFYLPVGTLFFLALIVGALVKLVLGPVMTIGYDDYRVTSARRSVSLAASQEKILREGGSFALVLQRSSGPACTDSKEE
ncbi:MAG: hypothetical protein KA054_03395 [Candidatus Moranbacteria bacterium]|nr:hypothetical protein [Candidatus Moranbacteria bacterium]